MTWVEALICDDFAGYRNARVGQFQLRDLKDDDVLIRVGASAASFASILTMEGSHQNRSELPFVPGTELAGVVEKTGASVSHLAVGDRVLCSVESGAHAGMAVAPARNVFRIPDTLPMHVACHFPTVYATAYGAIVWKALPSEGEVILVHGASGGSGLAAVEISKAIGLTVIAVTGNDEKAELARSRGADHVVYSSSQHWPQQVRDLTDGRGVDICFDPVGGEAFRSTLRCIAPNGRILAIGFASGEIPSAPVNLLLVKHVSVIGFYWGYYLGWAKQKPLLDPRAQLLEAYEMLFRWFEEGRVRPHTDRQLALQDFIEAYDLISSRKVRGRVVFTASQT